jgi:hypothetical protein
MAARKAKAKAPKAASGKAKRAPIDWEAISNEYHAGVISIRGIAARHGISDKAIRLRADAEGWERCLLDKVQQAAKAQLLRTDAPQPVPRGPEKDVIAAAAQVIVNVVREHQAMLCRARSLVDKLLGELEENSTVSLPQRIGATTNLSAAMKNVIALERQAFSVDSSSPTSSDEGADVSALNDELDRRYGRRAAA